MAICAKDDISVILLLGKIENEAHFGLTSLSPQEADAKKILKIVRGHWTIENRDFYVRDQTLLEDRSAIRSGVLLEAMVVSGIC